MGSFFSTRHFAPTAGEKFNLIQSPWGVVHPGHHGADVKHMAWARVQFLHEELIVLHHVELERVVDVTIQVIPAVEMVFEAWDRVMAQHHIAPIVFNLHVFCDLHEFVGELLDVAAVMVSFNQENLAGQRIQNRNRHL